MMVSMHAAGATLAMASAMAVATAMAWAVAMTLSAAPAHAQTGRPAPVPSPSPVAPGQSETPLMPAVTDSGVPGTGNKPVYTGNVKGDNTPRKVLQRRSAASAASVPSVDDRAAAKAAARPVDKPVPRPGASAPR